MPIHKTACNRNYRLGTVLTGYKNQNRNSQYIDMIFIYTIPHNDIFNSVNYSNFPAMKAVVQAAWKLKPPVRPSISRISPAK